MLSMLELPGRADFLPFKRFISILSLVAVFFLPLHFHFFNVNAKVANECACVQGTRQTAALAQKPPAVVPVFDCQPVVFVAELEPRHLSVSISSIRAPPSFAVL